MSNSNLLNYKYIALQYEIFDILDETLYPINVYGIGIEDLETNMIHPSPFTNYIKSMYRRKTNSLSKQRNAAYELTKFLNYIRKQINKGHRQFLPLKELGITGLNLHHGSQYISHASLRARTGNLSPDYVYRMEKYLISFYSWLHNQSIIEEPMGIDGDSPFDDVELGTIYPGKDERVSNKLVDFGENRYELSTKFIRLAERIAPEIALGIAFQFYGGLRVGEVVNLKRDSLDKPNFWSNQDFGENVFILKIRDNQSTLFGHKKNQSHEQVKNPRNQSLLVNSLLSTLYRKHKANLASLEKKGNIKNKDALFVSPKTGLPISGKSYYDKFTNIKKEFMKQLAKEHRIDEFDYLSRKSWSTHICRGVFTNFLLEIGANITDVAIARGDRNIFSVLSYVEEQNAVKLTSEAINKIREAYKNQTAEIEEPHLNYWSENYK